MDAAAQYSLCDHAWGGQRGFQRGDRIALQGRNSARRQVEGLGDVVAG